VVTPIFCACGNKLGALLPDGRFEMKHRGRRSVGPRPDEVECERCKSVWRPEASEDRSCAPVLAMAL
jgi:hypothetical protein